MNRREERRAALRQKLRDSTSPLRERGRLASQFPWRQQQRQRLTEIESDSSIAVADLLHSHPHHAARRHHGIQIARPIVGNTRGQNLALQIGNQQRRALQALDGIEQRIHSAAANRRPLPAGGEASEGGFFHRLNFAPQPCQALAPHLAHHFRIAPLGMRSARAEFAFQQFPQAVKLMQRRVNRGRRQAVATRHVRRSKRPMGSRVAPQNFQQRLVFLFQKNLGQAGRQRRSQRIAIARSVFRWDVSRVACDAHSHGSPRVGERLYGREDFRALASRQQLGVGEIAQLEQQVVDAIGVTRAILRIQRLQAGFDFIQCDGIQQLAQVNVTQ